MKWPTVPMPPEDAALFRRVALDLVRHFGDDDERLRDCFLGRISLKRFTASQRRKLKACLVELELLIGKLLEYPGYRRH